MDENQTFEQDRIIKINIEEEMKSSYIDYSMSVIVARALPDVRDGFKPVHRRILYGMLGIGNTSSNPYKKCARVVGEVLGKYHPHGDSSVYGALVRMGQEWNMRYCLVDGQGNFGSVDGDSPAAMRYTECRLSKMGEHIMDDLEKDTVDMMNNFDDSLTEPTVMPTKIPNLLVNGGNGIAVGMATNIPTHNLGEVIDGCCAYIDNPDIDTEGLMKYIPAPDFPTGAYIYGLQGVKDAYVTGRGRIIMRAKAEIESDESHDKIVITEIPYGVNKQQLIEYIAELVKEGKLEGISNANDETGRQGMRIVVDVKRDANANVILNKLFKMTALQSSFSVNNIALVNGRPRLLSLKECVHYFVEHRHDVTIRRTKYDLRKAQERAHILEGLIIAVNNIDEVVHIIRNSKTPTDAQRNLETRFNLDELQSKAIVDMRLAQLTGLRVDQLHQEYDDLMKLIADLQEILDNGFAYESNGSVYFDVEAYNKKHKYGVLSGRNLDDIINNSRELAGVGEKKNQADFALWKKAQPEHIMRWPSKWSDGFPGWHCECTAMGRKYLGNHFDIHGGGMDLIFPHHECEIAQAVASQGDQMVHYWIHNNMITINGQKMGKSLGNFITLQEFFDGSHKDKDGKEMLTQAYTPMTIRFFILQAHYRSTVDFSNDALISAEKGLERLMDAHRALKSIQPTADGTVSMDYVDNLRQQCYEALNDDFNTPIVISHLFDATRIINQIVDKKATITLEVLNALTQTFELFAFDLLGLKVASGNGGSEAREEAFGKVVDMLLEQRMKAKANKDWATSDMIRDQLAALGFEVKDTKDGFTWKLNK